MNALAWAALGFACGALPFSVWLSRGLAGADARTFGDGNPGAASAWRI
jgi:acyl phosphate:glycerol-3-phosphate acyltransferase